MTDQKETPTKYIAKVSVKLPDFRTEDPDLWFLHAEAALRNIQITQLLPELMSYTATPGANQIYRYSGS